jgi:hypothetical protein
MSALGASMLAVSVFLPWYRVSSIVHSSLGAPAGRQLTTLSAHQALPGVQILLLVLAGMAMLDALLPVLRTGGPLPGGAGGSVVLLGAVAAGLALYRMVDPPAFAGSVVALSLRDGPWLALLGSVAIALGGVWPRCAYVTAPSKERAHDNWPGVSSWTPEG